MQPDAYDALSAAKCLPATVFAMKIANLYVDDAITSIDDVNDDAKTHEETRQDVVPGNYGPDVAWELEQMIGEMTRPLGAVYTALAANGHSGFSLCTATVARKVVDKTTNSGYRVVHKTARFVSDDPAIVLGYREANALRRVVQAASRANLIIGLDERRLPGIAQQVAPLIANTHRSVLEELPALAKSNSGGK
jgi:hypothetical protein